MREDDDLKRATELSLQGKNQVCRVTGFLALIITCWAYLAVVSWCLTSFDVCSSPHRVQQLSARAAVFRWWFWKRGRAGHGVHWSRGREPEEERWGTQHPAATQLVWSDYLNQFHYILKSNFCALQIQWSKRSLHQLINQKFLTVLMIKSIH